MTLMEVDKTQRNFILKSNKVSSAFFQLLWSMFMHTVEGSCFTTQLRGKDETGAVSGSPDEGQAGSSIPNQQEETGDFHCSGELYLFHLV